MRIHRRSFACLGVALALLVSSTAAFADVAPLPKPQAKPVVTPLAKPAQVASKPTVTRQTVTQQPAAPQRPATQQTATRQAPVTPPVQHTSPPASASGGRTQPAHGPAASPGGRDDDSLSNRLALLPTKLAQVGHESLPSYDTWPSWVLGAITLLASAEAFLLVRLARARRFAQADSLRRF
jgi:hypothetical protein